MLATNTKDVDVVAVCDVAAGQAKNARDILVRAGRPVPEDDGEKGPTDYRRMLDRKDLDAVIIATPISDHATMSIDALRAGKAVLSEVSAAVTMDDCWALVRAVEETGKLYMMAENVCYFRECMLILNMVQQGLFGGGFPYGECGYVHDCRSLLFNLDGSLTWRGGMLYRDSTGIAHTQSRVRFCEARREQRCPHAPEPSARTPAGHQEARQSHRHGDPERDGGLPS
ncbi:MAG: Gfo/Idh/MocA family oxidoreductase [Phycisphaerae bacterium]|nr:Gfo/Idh/MocA family oxidoreductase [Phycisphaerae bacterium]